MCDFKKLSSAGLLDEFTNLCFRTGKAYQDGEDITSELDTIKKMQNEILERFVRP